MPRTVRLSPLLEEHSRALGVDLVFFIVLYGVVVFGTGSEARGPGAFAVIGAVVVFHWLQMRFLVKLRFDEDGITVVRVPRRRRVLWSDIAGLVYTERGSSAPNSGTTYQLRLVLRGQEPPLGRFLTKVQRQDLSRGPLLMALPSLDDDGETKGDHRRRLVLRELAEHGFPAPEPRAWEFRTPLFSPRALTASIAMDMRGARAVAVQHGTDVSAEQRTLLDSTLPELAVAHGGAESALREPDFTSFFFEGPEKRAHAGAFLTAARAAVPAQWQVSEGTLPQQPGADGARAEAGAVGDAR
ncbi:PH domain-containing protein [Streptomyces sp. CA-111067]|uniref:PH domain-containing protein n=1 Tax=Streptomyces sp. CA-111067 TaxID=3240046 RepID=UPI003D970017